MGRCSDGEADGYIGVADSLAPRGNSYSLRSDCVELNRTLYVVTLRNWVTLTLHSDYSACIRYTQRIQINEQSGNKSLCYWQAPVSGSADWNNE